MIWFVHLLNVALRTTIAKKQKGQPCVASY